MTILSTAREVAPFTKDGVTGFGNVWTRRHVLSPGQVIPGHRHRFDHLSILMSGKVKVSAGGNETIYTDRAEIVMRKDVFHWIEAIEPSIWLCVFAIRDTEGQVVEDYTGEQDPLFATDGLLMPRERLVHSTTIVPVTQFVPDLPERDRLVLTAWIERLYERRALLPNLAGPGRFYTKIREMEEPPPPEWIQLERQARQYLTARYFNVGKESNLGHYVSMQINGAAIHPHSDIEGSFSHPRVCVMLQKPETGGRPIVAGQVYEIPEGGAWAFDAALFVHRCEAVHGSKARIIASFGYLATPGE